jgi:hypothetical protein
MSGMVFAASAGTSVSDAVSSIFTIAGQCISVVTDNAILLTFFAAGLVGIAIGAVRKLKHM